MTLIEYIAETIAGTTVMTAFSYLVSASFGKLFAEPILINYVMRLSRIGVRPKMTGIAGWLLHYLIGLLFVWPYHRIWHAGILPENWVSAFILGAASGIIGILGWMLIFRLPRKEPRVAFTEYYLQLFFAHIFFAAAAFAVHLLF